MSVDIEKYGVIPIRTDISKLVEMISLKSS